ncbi:hypothetical protein [Roseibium album]|uniref:hypothetical protein n=1 Tax=Roseibium album TaxID=311410 RepID=UPI002492A6E6|nr:hypothetical protein [Roseibium album]
MHKALAAGLFLALSNSANAGEAFSWTGSYEGFVACDRVMNGAPSTFGRALALHFVQDGNVLHIATEIDDPSLGNKASLYNGLVMASPAGDFTSGYLEACQSRFPYKELIRIFPASTTSDEFGFSASTVFVTDSLPGAEGALLVENCRWSATRVSREVPKIKKCETPPSAN